MALIETNLAAVRSCGTVEEKAPLSEPVVVNSVFITVAALAVTDTCVRLVGFEELAVGHGETAERRIVSRVVMSTDTAREIIAVHSIIEMSDDLEGDWSDSEPSLGASNVQMPPPLYRLGGGHGHCLFPMHREQGELTYDAVGFSQVGWGAGARNDLEDEHDGTAPRSLRE